MNLNEIKQAVNSGKRVHWSTQAYTVIKDNLDQYFIRCNLNESYIALNWLGSDTLNGKESEFFIQ